MDMFLYLTCSLIPHTLTVSSSATGPLIGNGLREIKWSRDPCRHVTPKGTVGYPSDSLASWFLPTTDIFLWQNWRQHCHHVTKSTEFPRWVATSSAQILEKIACNNCTWNHMLKLFHAIIFSVRRPTADKIIACNYCIWNHSLIKTTNTAQIASARHSAANTNLSRSGYRVLKPL